MYQYNFKLIFFLLSFMLAGAAVSAQKVYKIGDNTMTIAASAVLELESTTKGFLPPRMTIAQRNLISPTTGLMVYCTNCGANGEPQYYNGVQWVNMTGAGGAVSTTVTSPTGRVWMDRNLGASQVATSSTDAAAYGSLFQWGRAADGHQLRTSGNTSTLSSGDTPGHADFILITASPSDWHSLQNDNLWQGVIGTNNPCPTGYRLPTEAEFTAEIATWGTDDTAGAFASELKLTAGGFRYDNNGSIYGLGDFGIYWSATISNESAMEVTFERSSMSYPSNRASGNSVRCIRD